MDNNYKQNVINIIDILKELVIKELNTDLSTQEYDSLCYVAAFSCHWLSIQSSNQEALFPQNIIADIMPICRYIYLVFFCCL